MQGDLGPWGRSPQPLILLIDTFREEKMDIIRSIGSGFTQSFTEGIAAELGCLAVALLIIAAVLF